MLRCSVHSYLRDCMTLLHGFTILSKSHSCFSQLSQSYGIRPHEAPVTSKSWLLAKRDELWSTCNDGPDRGCGCSVLEHPQQEAPWIAPSGPSSRGYWLIWCTVASYFKTFRAPFWLPTTRLITCVLDWKRISKKQKYQSEWLIHWATNSTRRTYRGHHRPVTVCALWESKDSVFDSHNRKSCHAVICWKYIAPPAVY